MMAGTYADTILWHNLFSNLFLKQSDLGKQNKNKQTNPQNQKKPQANQIVFQTDSREKVNREFLEWVKIVRVFFPFTQSL